jgi:hypothetical protein
MRAHAIPALALFGALAVFGLACSKGTPAASTDAGTAEAPAQEQGAFHLLVTGDNRGEIAPCG